ncbi:MAG TPA: prepilin-type N-terminal cleavage/methylation domain-containing protein [Pyrinomonadaceae bacterium]|jgi:prepilin-type N-terminal cleavage/methylation domain-containing protein
MKKRTDKAERRGEAGFSLIELMVALGVTLVIMVIASRMLAMTMAVRTRENQRSEAIADTQRALQAMTREISNAGLGLANNGLVDANSNGLAVRVRTNLNAFCGTTETCDEDADDPGEDVVFVVINNTTGGGGDNQRLITRQDRNSGNQVSALANRVDDLAFTYVKADGTTTLTASEAQSVKIAVAVTLPAVGSEGQPGYQPLSRMQLTSEAVLRNLLLDQ